jgi:poly(3-hydroxybutyrate) depolymerase
LCSGAEKLMAAAAAVASRQSEFSHAQITTSSVLAQIHTTCDPHRPLARGEVPGVSEKIIAGTDWRIP